MGKIIDTHIHLDQYEDDEIVTIASNSAIEAVISVSMNIESCKRNLILSKRYTKIKPAFGFHPEQALPTDRELSTLLNWINDNRQSMVAVGEVGLPYFMRADQRITASQYSQYVELLEIFIELAKRLDKPLALHAVYSDAPVVCNLLEKHSFSKAHFHWFKGDAKTAERMMENGYFVSITPEVVMENQESVELVRSYPIGQIMVETDGPWPFKGPFAGKRTTPLMIQQTLSKIAEIKKSTFDEVTRIISENSKGFYKL